MNKLDKFQQLKQILVSNELEFILEAHNGISAKIVEESGFKAIWASGLAISASLGVRDSNEASWSQIVEILEFMSDCTKIPILLDGDTGYGNFNNVQRLIKKLEQRSIAGVCIEDKIFPKTNSFINGKNQVLADIDEFCGKIKAGKDAQTNDAFCLVARVEAFIVGLGLEETLKRAEAYRLAGADAILIHSKQSRPSEIETFMKEWGNRHPIVIVPTTYYSTPIEHFEKLGISSVIWANHSIRGSAYYMKEIAKKIYYEKSIKEVEDQIIPIKELFRLQNTEKLLEAEDRYIPKKKLDVSSFILAGNAGRELGKLTESKPKCMLEINGKPMLYRLISHLNFFGIQNIYILRGYQKQSISLNDVKFIDNMQFETTKGAFYLYLALNEFENDTLICYGDSLFKRHLIDELLNSEDDFTITVDAQDIENGRKRDLVLCNKEYTNDFFNKDIKLIQIKTGNDPSEFHGEWVGLLYIKKKAIPLFKEVLTSLFKDSDFLNYSVLDVINSISEKQKVSVLYTKGGWIDIDTVNDYEKAGSFF